MKGSNNTEDLIFLLSYADTDRYFANESARICTPTNYAVSMGADVRTLDDGLTDAGWWWLRSPGEDSTQASFVNFDGTRYTNRVGNEYLSVRPALWIDLENYASSVKDVGAEALSAEAKAALISIQENYQEEFGEYMDVYYPNGDAVFFADLDGDGIEELVLNE